MAVSILLIIGGAAALVIAADKLVDSSGYLAEQLGVSPIIVGAVVIGFGSSLPEMLVSMAALDQPNGLDLAIGNVVGSNIANVGLVLGFSVLLFPFRGASAVIRREGMAMTAGLILMSAFIWDQELAVYEGVILLLALVAVGFLVVRWAKSEPPPAINDEPVNGSKRRSVVVAVVSLTVLALAARAMVIGAEGLAERFGLSEGLVGLTILALGTSLPELGAVVASARKGRNDLVLGNVIGSNVFNSLGVAGVSAVLGAGALASDFRADLVVMVAIAAIAGIASITGDRLRRAEGALLLVAYPLAVYLAL